MTREEALEKLSKPAIEVETVKQDFEYIATKLGITVEKLQSYMDEPNKTYRDYKNQESLFNLGAKILKFLGVERAIKR